MWGGRWAGLWGGLQGGLRRGAAGRAAGRIVGRAGGRLWGGLQDGLQDCGAGCRTGCRIVVGVVGQDGPAVGRVSGAASCRPGEERCAAPLTPSERPQSTVAYWDLLGSAGIRWDCCGTSGLHLFT